MNTENKKPGGRPKLANYQKRTKCFRVMFNENDYIYIQSKADAIRDLSGIANNVNQIAHQMHIHGLEVVKQHCITIITEISRIIAQIKNDSHDSEH